MMMQSLASLTGVAITAFLLFMLLVIVAASLLLVFILAGPRGRQKIRTAVLCMLAVGGLAFFILFFQRSSMYEFDARAGDAAGGREWPVEPPSGSSEDLPESAGERDRQFDSPRGRTRAPREARLADEELAVADAVPHAVEVSTKTDLPDWVSDPPASTAEVYRRVLEAGPWSTDLECQNDMDEQLTEAAAAYLVERIPHGNRQLVNISPQFMRKNVVADTYLKSKESPALDGQKMHTLYHLLEFDQRVDAELADQARQATIESRLIYAGFSLASLLALVTAGFGYLRLDAVTDGKYKRRLQAGVGGVVVVVAAAGWLLSEMVVLG